MNILPKTQSLLILLLILLACENSFSGDAKILTTSNKSIVISNTGFSTPESVKYYAAEDVYFVSNINGSPFAADGNGFISKVNPNGKVEKLKFIDGSNKNITLHAPKGMAIHKGKLYVADINQVHIFELPSGKQRKSITIKGSTFLNGITAGRGNYLYVTDSGYLDGFKPSGTDAVYKVLTNGKYKTILKNTSLGHPNGIIENGEKLTLVTFGSGKIINIDKFGKQHYVLKTPKGGLDGLLKLRDGRLVVSSWGGSSVYIINKDKKSKILIKSIDAPADLGYDSKRNRILIPLFKQNKVVLLSL